MNYIHGSDVNPHRENWGGKLWTYRKGCPKGTTLEERAQGPSNHPMVVSKGTNTWNPMTCALKD